MNRSDLTDDATRSKDSSESPGTISSDLSRNSDLITDVELWSAMMNAYQWAIELQDSSLELAAAGLERAYRRHFGNSVPSGKTVKGRER